MVKTESKLYIIVAYKEEYNVKHIRGYFGRDGRLTDDLYNVQTYFYEQTATGFANQFNETTKWRFSEDLTFEVKMIETRVLF